ncbi:hypothetical protein [Natronosalvus vescus]|uniref:hypothetical protein n=1 Tax=Natronosalvus vescus TaxID=2953881 RepID=UPI002091DB89|nr:hypothetical protein [Natronosalvus vescus]
MVSDRELVDKWRTQVLQPASEEVKRLLERFPDRRSLTITFDRFGTDYRFSSPLLSQPDRTLEAGKRALGEFAAETLEEPGTTEIHPDDRVYLRVTDAPARIRCSIPTLGSEQLNRLVALEGRVVETDSVRPRAVVAAFRCDHCGEFQPVRQPGRFLRRPGRCHDCNASGPFTLTPERGTYVDAQTITVGEGDRSVPVELEHDLVGAFDIGDRVDFVAIPRARSNGETTTATLELEAVSGTVLATDDGE